ncbi:MAG: hypothetical protein MAG715_01331 [Methanonatronarchaeales archaeon]|nr:hypothetical protein [Methanonatronarchaeales archaeon]
MVKATNKPRIKPTRAVGAVSPGVEVGVVVFFLFASSVGVCVFVGDGVGVVIEVLVAVGVAVGVEVGIEVGV